MNEDYPLISIAMPVRNNAATLDLALRSIQTQTCANWELILIDDGSSDDFAQPRAAGQRGGPTDQGPG